jgi:hypothetical protein
MPLDRTVRQLLVSTAAGRPEVVARSAGVPFAVEEAARTVVARYGDRPAGLTGFEALFAVPFAGGVAVVQVADAGFRFLLLGRPLYEALGDPFTIADRFPADWSVRGELPTLEWPDAGLPRRMVADLKAVMTANDQPLLLGIVQALLDGSRVRLDGDRPLPDVVRAAWQLLPDRSRAELWPATFAFADDLRFSLWAGPPAAGERRSPGVLSADQCRDYPEGRYELALQTAVEAGDQRELDRLLARRSSQDTLKLAATMVALAAGGAVLFKLLG